MEWKKIYKKCFKDNMFLGTGVIIDPKGLVLTSVTVVPDKARDIRVYLKGGKRVAAEIVKVVTNKEFSLIRIKTKGDYPFLSLGDSNTVKLGQPSITLGNAFMSIVRDDHVCINSGIISGIYKLNSGRSESKYTGKVIETTTLVNDYMDGSPLINKEGRIIGMLSLNYSTRRWLGTAVPINILKPLFGKYRPWHSDRIHKTAVYLGLDLTEKGDVPAKKGELIIDGISDGSPASRAGIKLGSRIVKVAGKEIGSIADYKKALKEAPSGKKIVIEAYPLENSASSTKEIKMPEKPMVYTLQPWLSF